MVGEKQEQDKSHSKEKRSGVTLKAFNEKSQLVLRTTSASLSQMWNRNSTSNQNLVYDWQANKKR